MPDKGRRNFNNFIEAFSRTPSLEPVPEEFRTWTAISGIAGALGRKNWMPAFRFTVRPNLFIGLVGAPASGKSSAIRAMYSNVFGALSETIEGTEAQRSEDRLTYGQFIDGCSPLRMYTGSLSSPKLGQMMSKINNDTSMLSSDLPTDFYNDNSMTLVTSEFGRLMGSLARDNDLAVMLTDAWDATQLEHTTVASTRYKIKGAFLNWIFGVTPDEFRSRMPRNAMEQGLLSRILPIYYDGEGAAPDLMGAPTEEEDFDDLRSDLGSIARMAGEFRFETEAMARREAEWIRDGMLPAPESYELRHYNDRRHVQLVKIAQCISAARSCEHIITEEDWSMAKTLLLRAEEKMPSALAGFGASDYGRIVDQTIGWLRSQGERGVPEALLRKYLTNVCRTAAEVDDTVKLLESNEQLDRVERGKLNVFRAR